MTQLGWVLVTVFAGALLAILGRMAQVWIAEMRRRIELRRLCEQRSCSYYTDYLRKGPQLFSHSQYHQAVDSYSYWQRAAESWEETERGIPQYTARMVQLYRVQARL